MSEYPIRFTKDGFHQYRNDYKKSSIQGTHITFKEGCTHALTVAHVPQVLERGGGNIEKESDNLTKSSERYNADEQSDFTQTEAEEWATEIAIRLAEGNLDPIPKNKDKQIEQYDFTYVSLFSGIGGFEKALNKFGGTCVFASEIDRFAAKAYEALYGEKPAGDITKINAKDIPDHDLLVGGFPCQAFSVAGKREGFADTRGTLFFDIARIAAEKKPKALLLENVKGLINHDKGNTLDTMIKTLNDIGYVVDFDVLNSKYFGVPQNRERIFIVAIREDLIEAEPFSEESTAGQTIVPKGKRRIGEWAKTFNFDFPEQKEVTTRLRDILESNVDEKYYLDEDKTAKLVTQLESTTGEKLENIINPGIIQQAESGVRLRKESGTLRSCLNHQHIVEGGIKNCDSALIQYRKFVKREGYIPEFFNPYNNAEVKEVAPTQSAQCSRINNSSTVLKIEETVPQMLGHVDLKGNDSIKRTYSTEGISPTLTTMGGGHREPKIAEEQEVRPKYRIRKLTPLECWRLQGFSDEAHEAVKAAGISDSQRYKQAGNAVTVNVIEAIAERLIPLIS